MWWCRSNLAGRQASGQWSAGRAGLEFCLYLGSRGRKEGREHRRPVEAEEGLQDEKLKLVSRRDSVWRRASCQSRGPESHGVPIQLAWAPTSLCREEAQWSDLLIGVP